MSPLPVFRSPGGRVQRQRPTGWADEAGHERPRKQVGHQGGRLDEYPEALADHPEPRHERCREHGGREVQPVGQHELDRQQEEPGGVDEPDRRGEATGERQCLLQGGSPCPPFAAPVGTHTGIVAPGVGRRKRPAEDGARRCHIFDSMGLHPPSADAPGAIGAAQVALPREVCCVGGTGVRVEWCRSEGCVCLPGTHMR